MKRKTLIATISLLGLVGGLSISSSSVEAGSYNPCPNGCYSGKYSCFCYTWSFKEKDAKTGGDTLIEDIIGEKKGETN